MNYLALGSLVTTIVFLSTGLIALMRDPKNKLNQFFFLFCSMGIFLGFTEYGYRSAETIVVAQFWIKASFLWNFIFPLELHFILLFSSNQKLIKNKLLYIFSYLPATFFSLLVFFDPAANEPVKVPWGWTYSLPDNIIYNIYDVWIALLALTTLVISGIVFIRAIEPRKKKQARIVFGGVLFSFCVGIMEFVPPMLGFRLPELTTFSLAAECLFILRAMIRYDLFTINPITAAKNILETIYDALVLVDQQGKIVSINKRTEEMLGFREDELLNSLLVSFIALKQREYFTIHLQKNIFSGENIQDAEINFLTKKPGLIPVSLSATSIRDRSGTPHGIIYAARDLTERKQAEEKIVNSLREKEILLQEIHHRVKNNLQLISSLLNLQIDVKGNPHTNQVLIENRRRVQSMARVHDQLYKSESLSNVKLFEYTQDLVNQVLGYSTTSKNSVKANLKIPNISLDINRTIYYGLIVNELVLNSLKHAFPDSRPGEINISLETTGEKEIVLTVRDNGVGLPEGADLISSKTLGLSLVNMLTDQLKGKITTYNDEGAVFVITFGVD